MLVCVLVRDSGDKAVQDAVLSAHSVTTAQLLGSSLSADAAAGELGVYSKSLPFPDDVIAGQYTPLGQAVGSVPAGGAAAADPRAPRTNAEGRGCPSLNGPAHVQVTAIYKDRSASAELLLPPAAPSGSTAAIELVLRLSEPMDTLCRLTAPAAAGLGDEGPEEPVGDGVGAEITGRVVDGRGFGLAAVRLEAQVGNGRAHAVAITSDSGSFRLTGLPRGAFVLRAQLAGFAPASLNRRADEARSELQLTLRPGGSIAGTLRDAHHGTLPQGAQLVLVPSYDSTPISIPLAGDGSFQSTGLPTGEATLRARAPGYAPLRRGVQIPAADSPTQISLRDLRLEMEPGGGLSGQVSGPTGAASGVAVQIHDGDGNVAGKALTDEHGEFHLSDLPAGRLRISATSSQGRGETSVDMRSGDEERVHIELR